MKVIVVVKKTRYETANAEAKRLIESHHQSVSGWVAAHDRHHRSLAAVMEGLERAGCRVGLVSSPYESFDPGGSELVVPVGGDGTFLAASHSVGKTPMLGVNSDPESSRGFFCGTDWAGFQEALEDFGNRVSGHALVQRMEVSVAGRIRSTRVLNEALVCNPNPAATSRFSLRIGESGWERNMSSGFWIGPPAGTTGAMRSAGGDSVPLEARLLQVVSRETIDGATRKAVTGDTVSLVVRTDSAAVYMDGPYRWAEAPLGETVECRLSDDPLRVVGLGKRR